MDFRFTTNILCLITMQNVIPAHYANPEIKGKDRLQGYMLQAMKSMHGHFLVSF